MKLGLYLQSENLTQEQFFIDMTAVKSSDIDLFVFPENCITPFSEEMKERDITDDDDFDWLVTQTLNFSNKINCAMIFSGMDKDGALFSLFVNPYAQLENEMSYQFYVKHTMTDCSSFEFYNYSDEWINNLFAPIEICGKKIGMTICYDSNHAAFSRAWGKNGVDILINSTGSNVDYYKWYRYNKVRAIENHCFNFCTMGYCNDGGKNSSYTYGFTPEGRLMKCRKITEDINDSPIGIYVYDTDTAIAGGECDIRLEQAHTENKYQHFFINPLKINELINDGEKVANDLYVDKKRDFTLVYILIDSNDIIVPEKILKLMYNTALIKYKEKRYIIINKWCNIEQNYFENILCDILRVRAMENYCAVILTSNNINMCYQASQNRGSQIIAINKAYEFGLDLDRTKGPELVWKKAPETWRKGYEKLIKVIS